MQPIYDVIKDALIERGWGIDSKIKENESGELLEFIHPVTGKRRAYIDAVLDQGEIEDE